MNTIAWQGFHHIALVTRDLDATIHFYRDILGMEAGEVMERRQRHCFIKVGGTSWGLHFFEYAEADIATAPDLLTDRFVFLAGAMQHLAFQLPDAVSAAQLRERLSQHGVSLTPINTLGSLHNFLFIDNNGILLEAAWS